MTTVEEVEEKFRVGFEYIKKFETLSKEQNVNFIIHLENIQALQYLVGRLEDLKVLEMAEAERLLLEEPLEESSVDDSVKTTPKSKASKK